MAQPRFLKVFLFLLSKYLAFFLVLIVLSGTNPFTNNKFKLLLILLFAAMLMGLLVFTLPFFYLFKIVNKGMFFFILAVLVLVEYFTYVYITENDHIDKYGVYNGVLTLFFFGMFFFKEINTNVGNVRM